MVPQLRSALRRPMPHLIEDVAGVGALVVILIASMHLPGFF